MFTAQSECWFKEFWVNCVKKLYEAGEKSGDSSTKPSSNSYQYSVTGKITLRNFFCDSIEKSGTI